MRAVTIGILTALLTLTGLGPPAVPGTGAARAVGDDSAAVVAEFVLRLAGTVPVAPAAVQPRARWQWPLPGEPTVVREFDPPEERWLPGHRGADLGGQTYAPVSAVADGTVTYSGSIAGVGIISVTHADGIRSTYQPVINRVEQGARVAGGDHLGQLGVWGSHCLIRACLHLGAVRGEDHYLDPLLFLQSWELTLLPHSD